MIRYYLHPPQQQGRVCKGAAHALPVCGCLHGLIRQRNPISQRRQTEAQRTCISWEGIGGALSLKGGMSPSNLLVTLPCRTCGVLTQVNVLEGRKVGGGAGPCVNMK